MSERCHWVLEEELSYFIPGCIGGGIGGPDECTCDYPQSEIEQERLARREAEEYVERLLVKAKRRQEFIDSMMHENKRLRDAIVGFSEQASEWKETSRQSYLALKVAKKELEKHRAENSSLLRIMAKAHAVMRETGWQLAPAAVDTASDGVLEAAAAEMESEFSAVLRNCNRIEEDRQ
ncbi:hypothetical protein [Profundibacter sp.]